MKYELAKQLQISAKEKTKAALEVLQKYPLGIMGDAADKYIAAKTAYDKARYDELSTNEWFTKTFKKQGAA